jgi:hypothetical protein
MWENRALGNFFDVAVFSTVTPLSSPISCRLSCSTVGLKISSLQNLVMKSVTKFSCGTLGNDQMHALVARKIYLLYHHFYPQKIHVKKKTSYYYMQHLINNKFY